MAEFDCALPKTTPLAAENESLRAQLQVARTQIETLLRANEQLRARPSFEGLTQANLQLGVVCLRFKTTEQAHEFVRACRAMLHPSTASGG